MQKFQVKFLYVGDKRDWEKIPIANKEPLSFENVADAEKAISSFISVWNKLNSAEGTPIFQARINILDWFNGHYVSDWEVMDNHLQKVRAE